MSQALIVLVWLGSDRHGPMFLNSGQAFAHLTGPWMPMYGTNILTQYVKWAGCWLYMVKALCFFFPRDWLSAENMVREINEMDLDKLWCSQPSPWTISTNYRMKETEKRWLILGVFSCCQYKELYIMSWYFLKKKMSKKCSSFVIIFSISIFLWFYLMRISVWFK